jgi:hypothetical protein
MATARALSGFLIVALALGGCAQLEQSRLEAEQQATEQRAANCEASGFERGSDAYRLCLLIGRLEQRIDRLETRIRLYDAPSPWPYRRYSPWY